MLPRFARGKFSPKNQEKYVGTKTPTYRSSWEHAFMRLCDEHPNVYQWASESIKIPYRHPFTGQYTHYVPDFIMVYKNKGGTKIAELVEIKPKSQTILEKARSSKDKSVIILNRAKWMAAGEWAKRKGMRFRVLNEDSIYAIK